MPLCGGHSRLSPGLRFFCELFCHVDARNLITRMKPVDAKPRMEIQSEHCAVVLDRVCLDNLITDFLNPGMLSFHHASCNSPATVFGINSTKPAIVSSGADSITDLETHNPVRSAGLIYPRRGRRPSRGSTLWSPEPGSPRKRADNISPPGPVAVTVETPWNVEVDLGNMPTGFEYRLTEFADPVPKRDSRAILPLNDYSPFRHLDAPV